MSVKTPAGKRHITQLLETHPQCHYCGASVSKTPSGGTIRRATADHIVPRCYGGTDAVVNLVLACFACNQRKGPERATCWCDQCCEALAFYATKFLDPNASGFRHGPKTNFLNEMARQGKAA